MVKVVLKSDDGEKKRKLMLFMVKWTEEHELQVTPPSLACVKWTCKRWAFIMTKW